MTISNKAQLPIPAKSDTTEKFSLPPFSKTIQPFVNSFQIPLKYDKKVGKQIFEQVSGVLATFTWLEA